MPKSAPGGTGGAAFAAAGSRIRSRAALTAWVAPANTRPPIPATAARAPNRIALPRKSRRAGEAAGPLVRGDCQRRSRRISVLRIMYPMSRPTSEGMYAFTLPWARTLMATQPRMATGANTSAPPQRRPSSSRPARAHRASTPDHDEPDQDGLVGEAEGLLAEIHQRTGEQPDDELADGGHRRTERGDEAGREVGDGDAGEPGDQSGQGSPPAGLGLDLGPRVHVPILPAGC